MLHEIIYLLKKEFITEWRQKYALGGILLYVIATIFISYLSFKQIIQISVWNALFWIILLFAAVNAVSKSFMQESKGRILYTYTMVSPQALILAKMIYNIVLLWILSICCYLFFSLFIGNKVENDWLFLLVLMLGSMGFSSILTLVSAIASKTGGNFTMMAILSFPIMTPLLITLIKASKIAADGLSWSVVYPYITTLAALNIIVGMLSYLLFPYVWKD